jgi:DNA-binding NtrC family response regulator
MPADEAAKPRMQAWIAAPEDPGRARMAGEALGAAGIELDGSREGPGVFIGTAAVCSPGEVRRLSAAGSRRLVVVLVGAPAGDPWGLLAAGASDVLHWPAGGDAGGEDVLSTVAARIRRWYLVDRLAGSDPVVCRLIGASPAWRRVLRWLVEVARFSDASVLISGESGTGKELAAVLVHALDPRRSRGPFVVVDCASIVASLSAPELFGHERGAFTGAHSARAGAFAEADHGVLFLDEIGELPSTLQPELLRVLQERTFKPLGSSRWQRTDFRLVCATNRNLDELERVGRFRRDLRSRLSAVTVRLPSLAERVEDVPLLARHFLRQLLGTAGVPELEPAVEAYLMARPYPGNIRELRQLVTQIAVRYVGSGRLTVGMVPEAERPGHAAGRPAGPDVPHEGLREAVRGAIERGLDLRTLKSAVADIAVDIALAESNGRVGVAARRLGVTPRALQLRRADPAADGDVASIAADGNGGVPAVAADG